MGEGSHTRGWCQAAYYLLLGYIQYCHPPPATCQANNLMGRTAKPSLCSRRFTFWELWLSGGQVL